MTQARGALSKLLMQFQVASRTAPAPAAKVMPFTTYGVGRDVNRPDDPTVTSSPLPAKRGQGDAVVGGALVSILDLRSVGMLLKSLLGQPVTTGAGPYTHTFPMDLTDRPHALFEMGHSDVSKYYRVLDGHVTKLAWDIVAAEQTITADIIGATETEYGAPFDAAPTSFASFRAVGAGGTISDGAGSTLGTVVGGNIEINSGMTGIMLADGLEGYGLFDLSDLVFSGKLKAVFDGASAYALARANTSTRLKIVSTATIGGSTFTLTVDMPYVELSEPKREVSGKSGLYVEMDWRAHAGATLPTVVLANDVTSY